MKVTVTEKENEQEIKFPCLMKSSESGNIVLFYCYEKGTVVSVGDRSTVWKVGEHSSVFSMGSFKPFKGTITLQND
jgi:hypothetical protein